MWQSAVLKYMQDDSLYFLTGAHRWRGGGVVVVKIALVTVPPWKRLLVSFKSHFASAFPEFEQSCV